MISKMRRGLVIILSSPSGAGKSTLIDIILGLIEPQQGQLKIDGDHIDKSNRRFWQNTIGFVAQTIFLSEGSISENIAFGVPKEQIDIDKVNKISGMDRKKLP